MIRKIMVVTSAACLILACKKTDVDVQPKSKLEYFPLTIGNQWVYDTYSYDATSESLISASRDTVIVVKDTVINNKKYAVLTHSIRNPVASSTTEFLRDSSGYLVESTGKIRFSSNFNSKDTIIDNSDPSQYVFKYVMKDEGEEVNIPAGKYKVVKREMNIFFNGSFHPPSSFDYFAKDVGCVYRQLRLVSTPNNGFRIKLVSYQLK